MSSKLQSSPPLRVLVYTRTTNYPHDSISHAVSALMDLGREHQFEVIESNDPGIFRDEILRGFDVVAFVNNSGNVLDDNGRLALQRYVHAGHGIVGIHGAAATMEEWPWYVGLIGATFKSHPEIQTALIHTVDRTHLSTAHFPQEWTWEEEWYNFKSLSPHLKVLLTVDEATYKGGEHGIWHPVSWTQEFEGGRVFYTAIGHQPAAFADPMIRRHLLGGLLYAAGRK